MDHFHDEFLVLADMADTLDDLYSRKAQIPVLMNKLRRKCIIYLRNPDNFLDEEAENLVLSRPTNKEYYRPLKDLLLLLGEKLTNLFDALYYDFGESLNIISEIEVCLNRLKPFFNAMRLSPRLEKSPCDPSAFTFCRARYLAQEYTFFLVHLSSIFSSYENFCRRILAEDMNGIEEEEFDDLRDRFDSNENGTFRLIHRLFEVFDRPNLKMLQGEWKRLVLEIGDMISLSVNLINMPHIRHNPRTIPTRNQYHAFILIAKLTRLLINKLSKFTNRTPHLSSQIPFDELEDLQPNLDCITNSVRTLHITIDEPHRPKSNIEAMQKLLGAVQEVHETILDHFCSLDPTLKDQHANKMLEWCVDWKTSFDSATKKYDLNFQGKNYWKKYFNSHFSDSYN